MPAADTPTATLLITCPDRPGIVAAVAGYLADLGANILHADQHTDRQEDLFLQRVEFETDGLDFEALEAGISAIGERFSMRWVLRRSDRPLRVAILASLQAHCVTDLLGRWQMGEMPGELVAVVSNHPDHADLVAHHGLPYHHLPVTADTRETQEAELAGVLDGLEVDLVVLARYMQILSPALVERYRHRIINIHHSFLPAFVGGKPYHQAHERGVKVIGATAHYVTSDLDQGPIIDQDVVRVSHRDEIADLVQKGRDVEKIVLARAVRAHLQHRILIYRNRTVVFV